jgi:hypothetical protein
MEPRKIAERIATAALIFMLIAAAGRELDWWGPEVITVKNFWGLLFPAFAVWMGATFFGAGYDKGREDEREAGEARRKRFDGLDD